MTNKTIIPIVFSAACLLYQAPSYSQVYKWTDDDGQIHYSDQPNKPDAEEFTIRQNTTTKPRPKKEKNDEDGEEVEAAAPEEKPKDPEISAAEKRALCKEAKNDIAAINSRGRLREINAKGEYIYLSENKRQQRLSTARKKQSKYCR